jgi:PST family polysaccharide transporter
VLLVVPGMLVCITNGATLIGILLGARWNAAAPIFSWLCVGGLTSGVYLTAYWLFVSQGRARELRMFSVWAAVINVMSYLIGSPWGVIGIAMASSLGFVFLTTPLMLFGASRSGPVRLADIAKCAVPFVLAGLAVYAVLRFGVASLGLRGLAQIAVATLASYALFILLSLASRPNRQLMRGAVRSLNRLLPA